MRRVFGDILSAADKFFETAAVYRRHNGTEIHLAMVRGEDANVLYDGELPQAVRRAVFGCDTAALSETGRFVAPASGDTISLEGGRWRVAEVGGICWRYKFGLTSKRIEIFAELQRWE